jgi:two-component system phosphate regulon sensor histidine kinase PhoR
MRFRRQPLRGFAAVALGAALEAGVSLAFGQTASENVGLATTLGVLIAVLAGAVGGIWAALPVAATGWALQFVFISDESLRAVAALPVWLALAAAAGWLGSRLHARSTERDLLEDHLSALQYATQDAVIGIDAERKIVSWNRAAEAIYGYSEEQALGRLFSDLAGDEGDGGATESLLEALGRGEQVTESNVAHRRSDGTSAIVSLTATRIEAESGPDALSVVVASDLTESVVAGKQVEELEGRYLSLAQQLPGVTYLHDVGDRNLFLYVSPQIGTMLGYRAQDWLSEPGLAFRLVHKDDQERVRAELAQASENGAPRRSEYRMLARDGTVVWVRDEATTLRASDGEPRYVQGYLLDIGAEKEARAERERLQAAERAATAESAQRQLKLDLLSRARVVLGASLDREAALRRAADLAVESLADWCVVDLLDEHGSATRAAVARGDVDSEVAAPPSEPEAAVMEVMRTGEPSLSDSRICVPMIAHGRTLGAITLLAIKAGRSYNPDDLALAEHLAQMAALAVDNVRLHHQVQEGVDAAHVLTYVADGVFLLDPAGIVRLWNPTAEAITGLEARRVVGLEAAAVIPEWETLAARIPVGVGGEPARSETVPIETQEGERWISISGVEFFGGTVYAFRDLTESRRLEQLKVEFVATASHELRTPLAAVYGAAQTLRRHDFALDEAGRERFVSLIVEESERLGRIVNDILLANELDVGRVDLRNEVFEPGELVERVVEAARAYAPVAVALETRTGHSVPAVASDRDRVRQVLVNLVENAIKYSPHGGRVEVGALPADKMVRFYVRDEGLGIPADEQGRVFDKFYRLDPQMTEGVGGIGLGLYICNELVQRMGGRIWVESEGDIGSTFLFEVPAAEPFDAHRLVEGALDAQNG